MASLQDAALWETGNGEIGNNGPHTIGIARWALGQNSAPRKVMSIGEPDCAETPGLTTRFGSPFFACQRVTVRYGVAGLASGLAC